MAKKGMGFGGMVSSAPDSNVVPEGLYLVKVVKMVEKHSKAGKLMLCPQYQIIEPKACKGQMIFENFVLGTDEDPEAESPASFKTSPAARNLKALLKKSNTAISESDDKEDVCNKIAGQEVMLSVTQHEQQEGDYKGQVQNRVAAYYEPGEREAKITGEAPKAAPAKAEPKAEAAPAKKKAKPAPPAEEEEEEEDEDDDDDEEDEDDD